MASKWTVGGIRIESIFVIATLLVIVVGSYINSVDELTAIWVPDGVLKEERQPHSMGRLVNLMAVWCAGPVVLVLFNLAAQKVDPRARPSLMLIVVLLLYAKQSVFYALNGPADPLRGAAQMHVVMFPLVYFVPFAVVSSILLISSVLRRAHKKRDMLLATECQAE